MLVKILLYLNEQMDMVGHDDVLEHLDAGIDVGDRPYASFYGIPERIMMATGLFGGAYRYREVRDTGKLPERNVIDAGTFVVVVRVTGHCGGVIMGLYKITIILLYLQIFGVKI